jgi:hypothetical protein
MNLEIILSGLSGTLAMTLFIELVSAILKKPFHVVRTLARMLKCNSKNDSASKKYLTYCIAVIVHYSIGVMFAYAFDFALNKGLIELVWIHALLFGGLAGLIGIIGWRIFFAIHPNPPKIMLPQYLLVIWTGHLIYAVGTFLIYLKFQPDSVAAVIPVC